MIEKQQEKKDREDRRGKGIRARARSFLVGEKLKTKA